MDKALDLCQATNANIICLNAPKITDFKAYDFIVDNLKKYKESNPDIHFTILNPKDSKLFALPIPEYRFSNIIDIVKKYVNIMTKDASGSEVDNVKHLYGATLLSLRAHPDNAALQLLFTYCVTFLGAGTNETLRADAIKNYHEGFISLSEKEGIDVWDCIDEYSSMIKPKIHDKELEESIVKQGKDSILLLIHEEKFNEIANNYLN